MAARIPADRVLRLAAALERACNEVPFSSPSTGTLWGDLNEARAIVSCYLVAGIPPVAVEVLPAETPEVPA